MNAYLVGAGATFIGSALSFARCQTNKKQMTELNTRCDLLSIVGMSAMLATVWPVSVPVLIGAKIMK